MANLYTNHLIDESYLDNLTSCLQEAFDTDMLFETNMQPESEFNKTSYYTLRPGYATVVRHLASQLLVEFDQKDNFEPINMRPVDIEELLLEAQGFLSILPQR